MINIARGDVVDTASLVHALQEGTIAGAGLDVSDPEPLPLDHPLKSLSNVVLAPHRGSATAEVRCSAILKRGGVGGALADKAARVWERVETERDRETERQRDGEAETERHGEAETERQTETETETETERQRQRDRETERQRQRESVSLSVSECLCVSVSVKHTRVCKRRRIFTITICFTSQARAAMAQLVVDNLLAATQNKPLLTPLHL